MIVYLLNITFVFSILLISRIYRDKCKMNLTKCVKENFDNKLNLFCVILIVYSFVSMVLVAGLRYEVGTDYLNYKDMFYILQRESIFKSNIEPIFVVICKILNIVTSNYVWLFITVAVFIYYFLYKICISKTHYYEMSIFLFIAFGFYTSTFNGMRQWMACIVGLYALTSIKTHTKKKTWLLILLAILCHKTAVILIPTYFFVYKNRSDISRIIIMMMGTILYFIPDLIMKFMKFTIGTIPMFSKYNRYVENYDIHQGSAFVFPIFCLIVYVLYFLYKKRLKHIDLNLDVYLNILALGYCFSTMGQKLMSFDRIQLFFVPIIIILIPQLTYCMKKRDKQFFYPVCIIMGIVFLIYSLSQNGGNPLPYRSVFSVLNN